jgi:sigma-B regulation protein RsbU (phosphoserine phosphatase)
MPESDANSTATPTPTPVHAPEAPAHAREPVDRHTMQCMEVWGGNMAIDSAVTMPGLNVWVYARPYKGQAAGGDVHYVSSCATGRISRLLVADVSGHGTKVADSARSLRDLMRRYINYLDQSKFVSTLNREFSREANIGLFATAIVATYWAPTDYLVASNAGHPRPLMFSARERVWRVLTDPKAKRGRSAARPKPKAGEADPAVANLPLGVIEATEYDQFAVRLAAGDLVLLYTDSLLEAQNAAGQELGLMKLVADLDPTDPKRLVRELVERVEAFGRGPPGDDVTIVALAPSGQKPVPTLGARIGALSSFMQTLAGAWRPNAAPVPWPELSAINILGPFFPGLNRRHGS